MYIARRYIHKIKKNIHINIYLYVIFSITYIHILYNIFADIYTKYVYINISLYVILFLGITYKYNILWYIHVVIQVRLLTSGHKISAKYDISYIYSGRYFVLCKLKTRYYISVVKFILSIYYQSTNNTCIIRKQTIINYTQ